MQYLLFLYLFKQQWAVSPITGYIPVTDQELVLGTMIPPLSLPYCPFPVLPSLSFPTQKQ